MNEPLSRTEALKLVARLFGETLVISPHARKRMRDHNISEPDLVNVLRAGGIRDTPEEDNGSWRYRVRTLKFCVVVAFRG